MIARVTKNQQDKTFDITSKIHSLLPGEILLILDNFFMYVIVN